MDVILLAHGVGIFAFVIGAASFWFKQRSDILLYQSLVKWLSAANYFLLGANSAGVLNILMFVRNLAFINKTKYRKLYASKLPLYFFIGVSIIATIFTFSGLFSILLGATFIFYTIILWNDNPKTIRIGTLIKDPIWLVYNFIIGAYALALLQLFTIISVTFSYIKFDTNLGKEKQ